MTGRALGKVGRKRMGHRWVGSRGAPRCMGSGEGIEVCSAMDKHIRELLHRSGTAEPRGSLLLQDTEGSEAVLAKGMEIPFKPGSDIQPRASRRQMCANQTIHIFGLFFCWNCLSKSFPFFSPTIPLSPSLGCFASEKEVKPRRDSCD